VARSAVEASNVKLKQALNALDGETIRAPKSGVVLAVYAREGELASPTDEKPLFIIGDEANTVQVHARIAEQDVTRVSRGVKVQFSIQGLPDRVFSGTLVEVLHHPDDDRNFITYTALIEADNGDGTLLPGMTASVEFIHSESKNVLRVPIRALYFVPKDYAYEPPPEMRRLLVSQGLSGPELFNAAETGILLAKGKRRIFVEKSGQWVRKEVSIGVENRDYVSVTSGLSEGERVIFASDDTSE
jgi:HlyD family secretion protein